MNNHSRDKLTLPFNHPSRSLSQLPAVYNKFNTMISNHFTKLYITIFCMYFICIYTYIS